MMCACRNLFLVSDSPLCPDRVHKVIVDKNGAVEYVTVLTNHIVELSNDDRYSTVYSTTDDFVFNLTISSKFKPKSMSHSSLQSGIHANFFFTGAEVKDSGNYTCGASSSDPSLHRRLQLNVLRECFSP